MPVEIDIARVARLARIALTAEELDLYGDQLTGILEHASAVQGLVTEGVEPTSHPLGIVNALRADEVEPTLDRDEVLAQAPDTDGAFFRVPPFLDE
jgi:aspartyl-tRNA(Asn)/glutamyl-tRNA(Gln) amidotransferase subunit C